ncbi:hypothetical protein F4677DRAFT_463332 [Hypoxylon crocopeplum]|nr:hypothetical protein F4677DRAFT_463332 [Hypoxylon crocopeplum]
MPGQPRKKLSEYSTNPNTIRARARKARLTEYQREVEQAKASDSKAITRAWKMVSNTNTYRDASNTQQGTLLEAAAHEVMDRRRRRAQDTNSKIRRFIEKQAGRAAQNRDTPQSSSPSSSDTGTLPSPTPTTPNGNAEMRTALTPVTMDFDFITTASSDADDFSRFQSTPSLASTPALLDMSPTALSAFEPAVNYQDNGVFAHPYDNGQHLRDWSPCPSFMGQKVNKDHHLPSFSKTQQGYAGSNNLTGSVIPQTPHRQHDVAVNDELRAALEASNRHVEQLERRVEFLTNKMTTAHSDIVALQAQVGQMNDRMAAYDELHGPQRVAIGVRDISDIAAEVQSEQGSYDIGISQLLDGGFPEIDLNFDPNAGYGV